MSDAEPFVGAEYDVDHRTAGDFRLYITENKGPWVYGIIRDGTPRCGPHRRAAPGQVIVVRRSFCEFDLVAGTGPPARGDGEDG